MIQYVLSKEKKVFIRILKVAKKSRNMSKILTLLHLNFLLIDKRNARKMKYFPRSNFLPKKTQEKVVKT